MSVHLVCVSFLIKLHGLSTVLNKLLSKLIQGGVTGCGLETLAKLLLSARFLHFCKCYNILAIEECEMGFSNFITE